MKILQKKSIEYKYTILYCVYTFGFIDFMLKAKSVLDYTNLFSPNGYKKNDKIILKYFQKNLIKLKYVVFFAINIEDLKKPKYHIFFRKTFYCLQ